MRSFVIAICAVCLASTATGGPTPNQCRVERQEGALAVCLELVFAQRVMKMTEQINTTLAHFQAATSSELRSLQNQYDFAQEIWLERLTENCERLASEDTVALQNCRLESLPQREARLALSLERASADFGAPVLFDIPVPENVEILIPLPVDVLLGGEARLPLLIPISAD